MSSTNLRSPGVAGIACIGRQHAVLVSYCTVSDKPGALESLETLALSGNMLAGPLPSALAVVPKLKSVDLSSNKIDGTLGLFASALPASGGAATSLLLDHNQLTGASSR